ncbi:MAG: AMP-binding protein, partial [Deltaproteobacteria bacterium]|nr:AMP-binding protein [Deltaproteobacteria bacterium]
MSSNNLCIHHLIEHQVERTPEKIAVQFEGVALTYRELNARANRLAHFLIAQNIRPDEVVGLQMGRSLDLMVALLGVLKAGAAYVPLDPQYPADRLEYMRADSGARISFTPEDFGSQWEDESDQNPEVPDLFSHNLAHVLYTSGSTGRPKGVEIEHASVVNFIHSLIGILDFSQDEVVVGVTGLTFDIAGLDMYCAWSTGATLILVTRRTVFNGDLLKQALGEHRATLLQTTPITWRALFDAGWTAPEGFKMLCGGEKLP